jgi:NTP pyrophosphatase (non-canonical NTP hydrolase)
MQTGTTADTENRQNIGLDEELADVLIAISVISKRLARKLTEQLEQEQSNMEGDKAHG